MGLIWAVCVYAISLGTPAGISALIVSVQPILTAVFAGLVLAERVNKMAWLGLLLGFAGVTLVVWERIGPNEGGLLGVGRVHIGAWWDYIGDVVPKTLCQRFGTSAPALPLQFAAATVMIVIPAYLFESMHVEWTGEFIFAMAWLVIVLSFGGAVIALCID